jgi:ribosomal protein L18
MSNYVEDPRRESRIRRHRRVRKKIHGTAACVPAWLVYRSNKHLTLQLIDDETWVTRSFRRRPPSPTSRANGSGATVEAATRLGTLVAERAQGRQCRPASCSTVVDTSITVVWRRLPKPLAKQVWSSDEL